MRTPFIPLAAIAVAIGAIPATIAPPLASVAAQSSPSRSAGRASAPTGAIPQLVDITAATGVRFDHLSAPEKKYIVESMSGGVALIDYDGDGYPDIYFTNAPSVDMALAGRRAKGALFHNNHDGTFTDVTDKAGVGYPCWAMGAVVGDYNNDGRPDLLVTCFGGVVLYRNNGNGTFTDVTAQAGLAGDRGWDTGATFGDYNNDGWPDLFVSRYVDFDLRDLPIFGSLKNCQFYGIEVQCGPRGLKGLPDSLYRNNGDETFTDVSAQSGVGDPDKRYGLTAIWSHFSDNGPLDLFVANDGEPNYLYRNDGNGHFTDVALEAGVSCDADGAYQANMGLALGDYLHTGRTSILITHFSNEYAALYRNDGKLSFTDASVPSGIAPATSHFTGWGDAFFDPDNTGWPDLILVNGHVYPQVDTRPIGTSYRETKQLFLNQRDGTFRNVSDLAGPPLSIPQVSRGLAVGDLFNDGHLEVVIENLEGQPMILRAESRARNHWISFSLEGVRSNRLALNARVRVTAGDLVQEEEIRSGGSYLSQNDLRLHFGLAAHTRIDKAEIFWPSGGTETLNDLASDRFYTVREGQGVVASHAPNSSPKFGAHP